MPGSASDPVVLDPFQRIVEVHWGGVTYVAISFSLSALPTSNFPPGPPVVAMIYNGPHVGLNDTIGTAIDDGFAVLQGSYPDNEPDDGHFYGDLYVEKSTVKATPAQGSGGLIRKNGNWVNGGNDLTFSFANASNLAEDTFGVGEVVAHTSGSDTFTVLGLEMTLASSSPFRMTNGKEIQVPGTNNAFMQGTSIATTIRGWRSATPFYDWAGKSPTVHPDNRCTQYNIPLGPGGDVEVDYTLPAKLRSNAALADMTATNAIHSADILATHQVDFSSVTAQYKGKPYRPVAVGIGGFAGTNTAIVLCKKVQP